jgi:hypothetical protein
MIGTSGETDIVQVKARLVEGGRAKQEWRDEKLASKREQPAKKAAEKARIEKLVLATRYSELKDMSVDNESKTSSRAALQRAGKKGFKLTHEKRADYVLQVQSLMSGALGEGSNDLGR